MAEKLDSIGFSIDRTRGSDFSANEVQEIGATNNNLWTTIKDDNGNGILINDENQLHVVLEGKADTGNSTTNNLGADATFTGTAVDTYPYAAISVLVYSDVASDSNGLKVEYSADGSTDWHTGEQYTLIAGSRKFWTPTLQNRYMRVVYTNGSIATSDFHIHTTLRKVPIKWSSHNIVEDITDEDDAELVKAVITGKSPDNNYININATTDGDLKISDNSSGLSIAQGKVSNTSYVHKFGYAPDFDSSDGEIDVWDGANDAGINAMVYTFSATANIDSLSSSSVLDTDIDIEIQGLDGNYGLTTQIITLNGQTRVPLSTNLLRVFRLRNVNGTSLQGSVYCYVNGSITGGVPNTAADVRAVITYKATGRTNNQTQMAIYTVPSGKRAFMRDWYASIGGANKNSNYIVRLYARPINGVFQLKHIQALSDTGTSAYQHKFEDPELFDEKTDIIMTVQLTASPITNAAFSAGFDLVIDVPDQITGFLLQEDGLHLLQENGDKILR